MKSVEELDNLLDEPLPWEIKAHKNARAASKKRAMSEAEVGDWSTMIGSSPG